MIQAPSDLQYYSADINNFVKQKGFHTPCNIDDAEGMLAKLMLVTTEIAEAAEAVREGNHDNFCEELADTLIRIFDIFGAMNENPAYHLDKKMAVNEGRPQKHNKRI